MNQQEMAASRRKLRDNGNNQNGLRGSRSKLGVVRSRWGFMPVAYMVLTAHACLHAEESEDKDSLKLLCCHGDKGTASSMSLLLLDSPETHLVPNNFVTDIAFRSLLRSAVLVFQGYLNQPFKKRLPESLSFWCSGCSWEMLKC